MLYTYHLGLPVAKIMMQKARSSHAAGRDLVLEAAQTNYLSEVMSIPTTIDSAKYTWFENPTARVHAIYTQAGFLKAGEVATPDLDVVRRTHIFLTHTHTHIHKSMNGRSFTLVHVPTHSQTCACEQAMLNPCMSMPRRCTHYRWSHNDLRAKQSAKL